MFEPRKSYRKFELRKSYRMFEPGKSYGIARAKKKLRTYLGLERATELFEPRTSYIMFEPRKSNRNSYRKIEPSK